MAEDIVVGIDLGTTNSEVAAWQAGRVRVLEEDGSALFPSFVGLSPEGKLLVGEQARNQYVLYPARTVKSIKRLMGSEQRVSLDGQQFSPQELSAMILRALKERAERVLGVPVNKAVITVPAYFSDAQRQATRDAGRIAGLEVVRMIHEPTAAVLAYESADGAAKGEQAPRSETVLIYDLGGGTLDVSIVQVESDVTEVLASHGDTHLGGDDFDQLVYDAFVAHIREKLGVEIAASQDRALQNRLLRAAEEAKKRLSFTERVVIREEYVGSKGGVPVHLEMEFTREHLERLVRPWLDRSLHSVQQALEGAGKEPADIGRILLVGGSTRIPLVSALLEKTLGQKPRKDTHPDLCVAQGAGIMAARVMGRQIEKVLVDVTPYTFGTSAIDEINGFPSLDKFVPLIHRNTPLPCSHAEDFFTASDRQKAADVRIYQGEEADARRNILVGRFLISGLSMVPAGNPIRMSMGLDVNGILHVTARETRTGLEKTVTIEGALSAMDEQQLAAARRRVDETAGDPISRAFEGLEVEDEEGVEPPEKGAANGAGQYQGAPQAQASGTDSPAEAADSGLPCPKAVQARALVEKARRLSAKMHADDREDAAKLIHAVEETIASRNTERLDSCMNELAEMLFFVEEKV